MQPENTNPAQNPIQPTPQQPAQPRQDFARPSQAYTNRPVQSFSNRPQPYAQPLQPQPTPSQNTVPQTQQVQVNYGTQSQQTGYSNPNTVPQPVQQQPGQQTQAYGSPTQILQQPATPIQQNQAQAPAFAQPQPVVRPAFQQPAPTIQQPAQPTFARKTFDLNLDESKSKRNPVRLGIIAIALIGIIGAVVGYLDKTQNSTVYTAILALDVIVAFGLLLRKQVIYKAAMGLAILTVTASMALALGYRGLTSNTVKAEAMFIEEAKKLQNQSPTKQLTHEQQQHLDAIQFQVEAQKESVGSSSALVYGKYGATILFYTAIAIFLTRPKMKEAFAEATDRTQ